MQVNCKCCKDCAERQIGCHSTCEKYRLFRTALDEQNELKQKQLTHQRIISNHLWNKTQKRSKK